MDSWEIPFVFALLLIALISFVWEKLSPDLTALSLFAILLAAGILDSKQAFSVFSNPAPITVGAMFIISAALDKCGVIDWLAESMEGLAKLKFSGFMLLVMLIAGFVSAFINNTPVVVVLMPILLTLSSKMGVPGSKVLIPLSYASIMGGMCTLLGTSTNIIVNGVAQEAGHEPIQMFEFAYVGIPIFIIGLIYLSIFGPKILPVRETLTSILSEEERREYIAEAFVNADSMAVGKTMGEAGILKLKGIRVIDFMRRGVSLQLSMKKRTLAPGDRLILACRASGMAKARNLEGFDFSMEQEVGLEQIAASEGLMVEGILGPNSSIIGQRLEDVNFRLRFRMVVLAVHRKGRNLREHLETIRLEFGDTLLMLGTDEAIENLRGSEDIILMDRQPIHSKSNPWKIAAVLGAIAGIITCAATGFAGIEVAAVVAVVFLFLTKCIRPKEGYSAVEWNILFIIFGMLAMGKAMEVTGASVWLADNLISVVTNFTSGEMRPYVMLACVYILTNILTEILSNNAAAVLMGTLAIGISKTLGADMTPFLFTVAIAASASFSTPIGYQTNTYVYGAGGYRFSDFAKIGLPLNIVCCIIAMIIVPIVWPF